MTYTETKTSSTPDVNGFYGEFGGAFIPELLRKNLTELRFAFQSIQNDKAFQQQYLDILKQYVGRPSPLYFSNHLSDLHGCRIYLKREDLNHTGSHKINNALGQALLAKRMGKKEIIAETGAGQHGLATATACALLGLDCVVFMGKIDMERQKINVEKMRFLGAKVISAESGSQTLKDATNEAIRYWINNPKAYYLIGSVVGPAPFPEMVAYFQAIISKEIQEQLLAFHLSPKPNYVIACIGGGSNAAGAYYHFYDDPNVKLVAIEAAGEGIESGKTAATCRTGKKGVLHGCMTLVQQDDFGQVEEAHSISAGLDYPGIGPIHAHHFKSGRLRVESVTDSEAMEAGLSLAKSEGIIPAIESAHALAGLKKIQFQSSDVVVLNLSGRGDKDIVTYLNYNQNA